MKWTKLIKAKNTSAEDLFKLREVKTNNSSNKKRQKIIDLMLKEGIKRRNVDPDVVYDFAEEHNIKVSFDDMLWISNNYPNNKKIEADENKAIPKGKKIEYEDDIVVVYDKSGDIIYKGMEDYEPMKREYWKWNKEKQYYTLGNDYIKVCLDI